MTTARSFKSAAEFRIWLEKNHAKSEGLWLRFFKQASGKKAMTRPEALDLALCFGWIDSRMDTFDDISWVQRFTPRRARSGWSKINTEHVERLTKMKVMAPAGLKEVERAKADGRWQAAYASPANIEVPADFLKELKKNKKATAFFQTLNKVNLYAIAYRLTTAKKPETRKRRMKAILAMMAEGKLLHPQAKKSSST